MKIAHRGTKQGSQLRRFMVRQLHSIIRITDESGSWSSADLCGLMVGEEDLTLNVLFLLRNYSKDPLSPAKYS